MHILLLIFLLTIADILFTYYGLSLKAIQEANPFLASLFETNSLLTVCLVVLYMAAACLFLYWARNKVSWLQSVLNYLLYAKIGVMVLHFRWIILHKWN
ncbi:MAG: hypothetical protein FH758_09885 [Firmicutes bacterium]|nr:hypothetical protein [Bacillota bacterium]